MNPPIDHDPQTERRTPGRASFEGAKPSDNADDCSTADPRYLATDEARRVLALDAPTQAECRAARNLLFDHLVSYDETEDQSVRWLMNELADARRRAETRERGLPRAWRRA